MPSLAYYLTTTDVRAQTLLPPTVMHPRISSAGRHLHNVIKRIGSLRRAYDLFTDTMWSGILNEMAIPQHALKEESRAELVRRLKKPFGRNGAPTVNENDFERLADVVARIAPGLKTPSAMRSFDYFVKKYDLTDEAKRVREGTPPDDSPDRRVRVEAEKHVRYCRADGVLIQGHAWTCRRCHHPNWSTLDALATVLTCEVCEENYGVPTDFQWHFVLDGYIVRGMLDHGLRGLIWGLGMLMWRSRYSFLFSPPLDLYRHEGNAGEVNLGDVDIACVVDGKFCIGESKDSDYDINDTLGRKLIDVATSIRPDVVVVACPDYTAAQRVATQVEKIRAAVSHLGIEVMGLLPPDPAQRRSAVSCTSDATVPAVEVNDGNDPQQTEPT